MDVAIGGLLGFVMGAGVWPVARHFIARTSPQAAGTHPVPGDRIQRMRGTISSASAIAEAGMATLGAIMGWRGWGVEQLVGGLVVTLLLLTISLVDFGVRRIPNALCLVLVLWALAQVLWLGQPTFAAASLGMLVGGGLFALVALAGRGAMGTGDVKLAAALGAVLGYPLVLQGLFWGVLAGGGAALLLLATGRVKRKGTMAYGPYLALGGWLAWMGSLSLWP